MKSFLESQASLKGDALPDSFSKGLEQARWPGRCQTVVDPRREKLIWYLDGAHTVESLACCVQWFVSPGVGLEPHGELKCVDVPWLLLPDFQLYGRDGSVRVLVFNCTSGRSGPAFLGSVQSNISTQLKEYQQTKGAESFFTHVIFCTNVTYADGNFKGGKCSVFIPVVTFIQQ